jgi:hypothetical protein
MSINECLNSRDISNAISLFGIPGFAVGSPVYNNAITLSNSAAESCTSTMAFSILTSISFVLCAIVLSLRLRTSDD